MKAETSMDVRRCAEASEWLVRLRDEADEEATVSGWLRWCESDPANAAAFERVQRMWRQMDRALAGELGDDAVVPPTDGEPEAWNNTATQPPMPSRRSSAWRGLRRAPLVALAAGIAAIAILVSTPHFQTLHTSTSTVRENATTTLPDGSHVELGARTTVAVDFNGKQRLLRLSSGGQAYFKVQPDKSRPFTVQAGQLAVTALGTAFDVKHQPGSIVVTVQEGVVSVGSQEQMRRAGQAAPWRVARGYQFVFSEETATATLSSVDTSAALAWREGRMEYTRAPLEVVVADLNRYALHPVEIADPAVAKLTFTGTVFTDSIDGWLTALPGALPVQVTRSAEGKVLLHPSAAP